MVQCFAWSLHISSGTKLGLWRESRHTLIFYHIAVDRPNHHLRQLQPHPLLPAWGIWNGTVKHTFGYCLGHFGNSLKQTCNPVLGTCTWYEESKIKVWLTVNKPVKLCSKFNTGGRSEMFIQTAISPFACYLAQKFSFVYRLFDL